MEDYRKNRGVFWVLAGPGSFWLIVFFLIPLGIMWLLSFSEKVSITENALTWTGANYLRALADPVYLTIIWKSVWISALATLVCLIVAFPVAFMISFASNRWKPWLLLAVILPFWINLLIRTYALIAVFRTRGYVNFGLEWVWDTFWLDRLFGPYVPLELLYNNFSVIAGLVYVYMPFMVLPLYATIERLDRSYLEASLDLGASQRRTFFSVTVPLCWPGIASGIILVFIPCLGSFLTPELLGGTNAAMIGNVIEQQFKEANDWPFGAALSFLLMYATFGVLAIRALTARGKEGVI